jgi:chorismate mutase
MTQGSTACRGVRGATTVESEAQDAVGAATAELLDALRQANGFDLGDLAAAIFTVGDDLAGSSPAAAAREHGWAAVPLLVVREGGDASVPGCLRVLLLWNTATPQEGVRHVYLRGAAGLRPDLDPVSMGEQP